jgi:outer membrane protein
MNARWFLWFSSTMRISNSLFFCTNIPMPASLHSFAPSLPIFKKFFSCLQDFCRHQWPVSSVFLCALCGLLLLLSLKVFFVLRISIFFIPCANFLLFSIKPFLRLLRSFAASAVSFALALLRVLRLWLCCAVVLCTCCQVRAQAALPQNTSQQPTTTQLTLKQAEQMALKNNPRISVSKLLALAEGQVTREVRSAELPLATGNLTGVKPKNGSRITAGALNNPVLFERAAGGATVGQLITDFGRTRNLVASAGLRAKAQSENAQATAADIVLAVDQAFYASLQAQALLNVAEATVKARQTTADQVKALTDAKLKSQLDLSFANVNLAQAKLLQLDAQSNKDASFANLNALLGFEKQHTYLLIDETNGPIPQPQQSADDVLAAAFSSRPDLAALSDQFQAEERFRRAEHDLNRPSINALAAVGGAPVRADQISPWYYGVGVNISIPIFNGFLFSSRAREADYRTAALRDQVADLRTRIARDVQITWLQSQSAYQRIAVSEQLLQQANLALDLAQSRYDLGLSSIVELSQAQLQQTEAQINNVTAKYQYQAALAALAYQAGNNTK